MTEMVHLKENFPSVTELRIVCRFALTLIETEVKKNMFETSLGFLKITFTNFTVTFKRRNQEQTHTAVVFKSLFVLDCWNK